DVKPGNILLIEGRVYVADFGIARAIVAAGGDQLTATGMAVGTPAYMSPEQATGSERVDHRTDVFALGCVLYEMLAGEPPHAGSTARAVIAKVIADPATRLSTIRDSVPSHVEAAVHRALAKSPADRFPGVGEMLSALRGAPAATFPSTAASPQRPGPRRLALLLAAAAVLIGVTAAALLMQREDSAATLDQLRSLIAAGDFEGAYRVAGTMDPTSIPDSVWPRFTAPATIVTSPAGATVSRRPYPEPDHPWEALGTTPLTFARFPISGSLLRLEAEGYHIALAGFSPQATDTIVLDPLETVPDGWRTITGALPNYVGGPDFAFRYIAPNLSLAPTLRLEDFRIARYEVTNAEFKEFIDAGGYADASYWEHPFVRSGAVIPWAEAMEAMTDSTGRPGPSTWRFGTFPEGQDAYPVTGVSWYESAAYARWAGRDLPTVYHWFRAASTWISDWMIPSSNMGGTGPMPVGANQGMSVYGIYDMAGNAREWAFNATEGGRFILGGGWSDSHYVFTVANGAPPFDRSPLNGFRLADYAASTESLEPTRRPIPQTVRDFSNLTPVPDDVFDSVVRLYDYDPAPPDAVVHAADTTALWTREYVTFDAAYGTERVGLYLYVPRDADGPLQTIVYFPGSSALWLETIAQYPTGHIEMVVRSGRAFAFPVYQSTFGRKDGF
ncbi:MAG TPA: SUMF1/EgtB/PvdO family nonheme iron enzyme, partial [Longimicrobiaceae bacterium]|nr:SUMF1/EgtB/PvdO family nonheme iron enzyme [Longimicrobiaceae bacterium]